MSPVVALDLDGGKDERALLVNIAGVAGVGGRHGVADVGLVGLGEDGEAVDAVVVDHRHHDGVVGGVGIAVIGRVVQEGVAAPQLRMKLDHRCRHDVGADEHVRGQALGFGDQLVAAR